MDFSNATIFAAIASVAVLSVSLFYCYAECRFAQCRLVCRGAKFKT